MLDLSQEYVQDDLNNVRFGKNSYLTIKNATLKQLYSRMLKKDFAFVENFIFEHEDFLNIDEVVVDNSKCTELEQFIFDVLENRVKKTGFMYFCFKLKCQDMQQLIDDGVCEWFEYMMMFLKFSRLNMTIKIQDDDIHVLPIAYQLVKKINNPRLSLYCDISQEKLALLPEDVNTVTKMIGKEVPTEKFVYSDFKIT
jgi:hypothetical protein